MFQHKHAVEQQPDSARSLGDIRAQDLDRLARKIEQARLLSLPVFMLILATKPCYVKLSPLIREAVRKHFPLVVVDTGHHYSEELTGAGRDFEILPDIDVFLDVRGTILERTSDLAAKCQVLAELLRRVGAPMDRIVPLVSGDTSTSATFPLFWYFETGVRSVHIEAGLRSRSPFGQTELDFQQVKRQRGADWALVPDEPFPEGVDTRVTSAVSGRLYAPLPNNRAELVREGYSESDILVTGSLSADALEGTCGTVRADGAVKNSKRLRVDVHRRENMTPARLDAIVGAAAALAGEGWSVSFVLTNQIKAAFERFPDQAFRARLEAAQVECQAVHPSYAGFISAVAQGRYRALITDSGGLQEEGAVLGVPCCTLRFSTDRPETVLQFGTNILAPPASSRLIVQTVDWFLQQPAPVLEAPYLADVSGTILTDLSRSSRDRWRRGSL